MKKIFILTGEPSGDKLASKVIKEFKKDNSEIEYLSVGGENLKALGIKSIYDLKEITYIGFTKAIKYWVPSIAVSAMTIYKGETFKEWNGEALITSLKDQSLRKIRFNKSNFIDEKILFKGDIGRIRDIKIHESGDLYLLSDKGELWRMYK